MQLTAQERQIKKNNFKQQQNVARFHKFHSIPHEIKENWKITSYLLHTLSFFLFSTRSLFMVNLSNFFAVPK